MRIPRIARRDIVDVITTAATRNSCVLRESSIREDHVHILVESNDERTVEQFITSSLTGIDSVIGAHHPACSLSSTVHITLLPPWHLDIMASFLRDQERYHQEHTVEEEINEIFRPDMVVDSTAGAN